MNTKHQATRKPCKECGGNVYTADFNENGEPVWYCNCCDHETKRQIRRRKQPEWLENWVI